MADFSVRREVIWERDNEIAKAVLGVSTHTLKRWSHQEGLTCHVRGRGTGARTFWITSEVVAFMRASSSTNHNSSD